MGIVKEQLWDPTVIVSPGYFEKHCTTCPNFQQAYLTDDDKQTLQTIACSPGPKVSCIDVAKNWKKGDRPNFSKIPVVIYDPTKPPIPVPKAKPVNKFKGVVIEIESPKRQSRKYTLDGKEISIKETLGGLQKAITPKKCGCGKEITKGEEYVQNNKGSTCLACAKDKIVHYKSEKQGEGIVHLCKKV